MCPPVWSVEALSQPHRDGATPPICATVTECLFDIIIEIFMVKLRLLLRF